MLKQIGLENFKPFNNRQVAMIEPITLIYGPNSAGKSSLLQSLLLLKQTMNENDYNTSALCPKGRLVNLGSFGEMVHGHDIDKKITISLSYTGPLSTYPRRSTRNIPIGDGRFPIYTYDMVFGVGEQKKIILEHIMISLCGIQLLRMKCKNIPWNSNVFLENQYQQKVQGVNEGNEAEIEWINRDFSDAIKKTEQAKQYAEIAKHIPDLSRFPDIDSLRFFIKGFLISGSRIEKVKNNIHQLGLSSLQDVSARYAPLIDIVDDSISCLRELIGSIIYLGPLREYPERHYVFSGTALNNSVGISGEYTNDVLFQNKMLVCEVNRWMEEFGIEYRVMVNRISDQFTDDVYSLRLIDKTSNISASSLDVGFGISQLLPILVQGLISTNSIICIEQPETHIHPRLQTVFGSFLRECYEERGNQFIIETHSEHIMLRLQKLIRHKELSNRALSVIYVDKDSDGSKCIKLRLNSNGGFIDKWPDGFFDEDILEVFS